VRIFLTGATGFIGNAFAKQSSSTEILALSRRPLPLASTLKTVVGDFFGDPAAWAESLAQFKPDTFVHLGWGDLPDYSAEKCQQNVNASLALVQLALAVGVKTILITGTCWEYGACEGPRSETDRPAKLNLFAESKIQLMGAAQALCERHNARLIWARPFFVYGPAQRSTSLIPSAINAIRNHRAPDIRTPEAQNDFVHVDDVAAACWELLQASDCHGIYNIGTGRPETVAKIVNLVSERLQGKAIYDLGALNPKGFWADNQKIISYTTWRPKISIEAGIASMLEN